MDQKTHESVNSKVEQSRQPKHKRIGSLGFVDYVGIGCQTSHSDHPYFFLFADVDTKDPETLRLTLQLFARYQLSFYWYETSKGWHVVSPCLMDIQDWDRARRELADILDNFYRNLVIRVEWKSGDSKDLHWDNFNLRQKYKESINFHLMIQKRFKIDVKSPNRVPSTLFFTHYSQIRVKNG